MEFRSNKTYKGFQFDGRVPNKAHQHYHPLYKWMMSESISRLWEIRRIKHDVYVPETNETIIGVESSRVGVNTRIYGQIQWVELKKGDVVYFSSYKGDVSVMPALEFKLNFSQVLEVEQVSNFLGKGV